MSAPSAPLTGENVEAVREALAALEDGSGDYEAVKAAVAAARFAPRPVMTSMDQIAEFWDYTPTQDSFTDTVSVARWRKVLTREQERELRRMAKFSGPSLPSSPSKSQES